MPVSPGILGVGAAVLTAGFLGGAVLGQVPPIQQRAGHEWLPPAHAAAFDHRPQPDLPDHYPLVTRAGRFEVHELGERGLYSQARYDWRQLDAYYPEEADWAESYAVDYADAPEPAVVDAAAPETGLASWQQPEPEEATAPLEPVGPAVAEVRPRVIDVAAALAAHDGPDGG